jgi:hypothetical protein
MVVPLMTDDIQATSIGQFVNPSLFFDKNYRVLAFDPAS